MKCMLIFIFLFHCFTFAQENSDQVVVLSAKGTIFDQARNGLINEIRDEFVISMEEITDKTSIEEIDSLIDGYNPPKVVVLIGNNAIRLYNKYSHENKQKTESLQVVAILALDIQRAVTGIANVNCIAYETPMVTALVNFRRVLNKPLSKVGVLYRKSFEEFVKKHTEFCLNENIEIKGIEISDAAAKHQIEINNALMTLLKKEQVEAIWVANDNVLLKPELLGNVWIPVIKKYKKIPLVVGVESLVSSDLNFGTFAVIPDPVALGEQTAEIIYELKADDWSHSGVKIHPIISMYSVLNVKKASEVVNKEELKIYEVSKVIDGKR